MITRELVERAAHAGHALTVREMSPRGANRFYALCTCGVVGQLSRNRDLALDRAAGHLTDVVQSPRPAR